MKSGNFKLFPEAEYMFYTPTGPSRFYVSNSILEYTRTTHPLVNARNIVVGAEEAVDDELLYMLTITGT